MIVYNTSKRTFVIKKNGKPFEFNPNAEIDLPDDDAVKLINEYPHEIKGFRAESTNHAELIQAQAEKIRELEELLAEQSNANELIQAQTEDLEKVQAEKNQKAEKTKK